MVPLRLRKSLSNVGQHLEHNKLHLGFAEHTLSAIGVAIFVGILSTLIEYVGVMDLLAGDDPETVADEEGLS